MIPSPAPFLPASRVRAAAPAAAAALAALLLAGAAGCKDDQTAPLPAVCLAEPAVVDFGRILPPLEPGAEEVVRRDLTITNRVLTNSIHGNADLAGSLSVQLEAPQAAPPPLRMVPVGRDPHFRLEPRTSVVFRLEVRVTPATDTGFYEGWVDLGTGCDPVPVRITVSARQEPAPEFVRSWIGGSRVFDYLQSVAYRDDGTLFTVDANRAVVEAFDTEGRPRGSWTSLGRKGPIFSPEGIAVTPVDGSFFLGDLGDAGLTGRVSFFEPDGRYRASYGPSADPGGIFGRPRHLAADAAGAVYVVDAQNRRVVKFRAPLLTYFLVLGSFGGPGEGPGRFQGPLGIAADRRGFVYVSDWTLNRISKFTEAGDFVLGWGSKGVEAGQFDKPAGVATDPEGNVYVADSGNNRIQKFDPNGAFLTAWGAVGSKPGQFVEPLDLAVGAGDTVFVADSGNHRIQVFAPPRP